MLAPFSGSSPREYTCECGKRWLVTRTKTIDRDVDSITCTCGATIIEWSEAASYRAQPAPDAGKPAEDAPNAEDFDLGDQGQSGG